jgi:hypothetical protein
VRVVCHTCKLQYDVDQIEHYRHPRVLHVAEFVCPRDTSPQAAGCLHRWMTSQRRRPLNRTDHLGTCRAKRRGQRGIGFMARRQPSNRPANCQGAN